MSGQVLQCRFSSFLALRTGEGERLGQLKQWGGPRKWEGSQMAYFVACPVQTFSKAGSTGEGPCQPHTALWHREEQKL